MISDKMVLLVGARVELEAETRAAKHVSRMRRGQIGRRIAWAKQQDRSARAALVAEQEGAALARQLRRKVLQGKCSLILQKFFRGVISRAELQRRRRGAARRNRNTFSDQPSVRATLRALRRLCTSQRAYVPNDESAGMGVYLWLFRLGCGGGKSKVLQQLADFNSYQVKKGRSVYCLYRC